MRFLWLFLLSSYQKTDIWVGTFGISTGFPNILLSFGGAGSRRRTFDVLDNVVFVGLVIVNLGAAA
jgi:hypothetical protein